MKWETNRGSGATSKISNRGYKTINVKMEQFLNTKAKIFADGNLLRSLLDLGVYDFTRVATAYAYDKFRLSFIEGAFYKQSKWTPRKKAYKHKIMTETRDLMDLGKKVSKDGTQKKGHIETRETYGKRVGKKSIGYAAVHNDPLSSYTANQHTTSAPIKRQFIGHSKAIYNEISKKHEDRIFDKIFSVI